MIARLLVLSTILSICFAACNLSSNRQRLKCSKVSLANIVNAFSETKDQVQFLRIDDCNTRKLDDEPIKFPKIRYLEMSCGIQELTSSSLSNLKGLLELNLKGNELMRIPNDLYKELEKLRTLDLSHNVLRNPTVDSLYYLSNLIVLNMAYNRVTTVNLGVLDVVPKLEKIDFKNNKIDTVPLGCFDEVANLKELDLSHNYISRIELGLFDQSKSLEKLIISFNLIDNIPLGLWDKNRNLEYLDIANNKLSKLELGVFDEINKLKTLIISGNQVESLPLGVFDTLVQLEKVEMANMKLKTIPPNMFDHNRKLSYLDLSNNELKELPATLVNKTDLHYFNISHNNIVVIPKPIFQWVELDTFDMSYNELVTIESDVLNSENLTKVYLRGNKINYLDPMVFATCTMPLLYLDIRDNRLVFMEKEFFEWVPNLERMEIVGNPWDCKCFNDLLKVMTKRYIEYSREGYFGGEAGLCIALNPFDCTVDLKNLDKYYEDYKKLVHKT